MAVEHIVLGIQVGTGQTHVSELFDFLIIFETAVSEMGGLID
jgi:hypothetical protein